MLPYLILNKSLHLQCYQLKDYVIRNMQENK